MISSFVRALVSAFKLVEAGFDRKRTRVPWLGGRHLQLIFG